MLAQSTQEALMTPARERVTADRVNKGGRLATIVIFAIVLAMLGIMFYWLGARRVNNFFVSRGDVAFQAQQYQDAVSSYSWAVRFDRSDAHPYLNRGYAFQKLQEHTNALPDFTRYIDLRPDETTGYMARAATYSALGKPTDAIADYGAVIALDSNNITALVGRARIYAEL